MDMSVNIPDGVSDEAARELANSMPGVSWSYVDGNPRILTVSLKCFDLYGYVLFKLSAALAEVAEMHRTTPDLFREVGNLLQWRVEEYHAGRMGNPGSDELYNRLAALLSAGVAD